MFYAVVTSVISLYCLILFVINHDVIMMIVIMMS